MPDEMATRYPCAALAYAPWVLAELAPGYREALERFAARALDDPEAWPSGAAERAGLRRVEALIGTLSKTTGGPTR